MSDEFLDELKRVLDRLASDDWSTTATRSTMRSIKNFLLRPFSWFVVALLSRDLTPDDKSDDDER